MTSPLLLDQLVAQHTRQLRIDADAQRAARGFAAHRSLAAALTGPRRRWERLVSPRLAVQACCA